MADEFYQVTAYKDAVPFHAPSVEENIRNSMAMRLCFVSHNDEGLTGFVLGLATPFLVNAGHYLCCELAWWVKLPFRHSSAGIKLLKALEDGAREAGCTINSMMLLENLDPGKVADLYGKLGYRPGERTFWRVL